MGEPARFNFKDVQRRHSPGIDLGSTSGTFIDREFKNALGEVPENELDEAVSSGENRASFGGSRPSFGATGGEKDLKEQNEIWGMTSSIGGRTRVSFGGTGVFGETELTFATSFDTGTDDMRSTRTVAPRVSSKPIRCVIPLMKPDRVRLAESRTEEVPEGLDYGSLFSMGKAKPGLQRYLEKDLIPDIAEKGGEEVESRVPWFRSSKVSLEESSKIDHTTKEKRCLLPLIYQMGAEHNVKLSQHFTMANEIETMKAEIRRIKIAVDEYVPPVKKVMYAPISDKPRLLHKGYISEASKKILHP